MIIKICKTCEKEFKTYQKTQKYCKRKCYSLDSNFEYHEINFVQEKVIDGHAVDFFLPKTNCILECDGDYWHNYPHGLEKDHIQTKRYEELGYKVWRLWGSVILNYFTKPYSYVRVS